MPSSNQGFVQRQDVSVLNPSSPMQAQPQSAIAPPPTVHTVDSSNVLTCCITKAELRPVITTLTRLFDETSRANLTKKRETEDNSRKIGAFFAKLNKGDISPNVSSKLIQLCSALDNSDFAAAQQIQVVLTTSDWDECSFWLAALKRMIKAEIENIKQTCLLWLALYIHIMPLPFPYQM
uniref:SRA1/Sec31 domain-containing protein n=1 Tax=Arundo donax TaxID=35708 RepID=A0A0A9FW31_ARUDO